MDFSSAIGNENGGQHSNQLVGRTINSIVLRVSLEVWTCIILLGYFDGNSHEIRIGNDRNPTS